MAINWTDADIEKVVCAVLKNLKCESASETDWNASSYRGRDFIGVYTDMESAIDAATSGYKAVRAMSLEERERVIEVIRRLCREEAPIMAALGVAETKMGRVDHKTAKHILVADKTPGTADIVSAVKTGDYGLTLTEMAPFGVVGSITPSTNPSETVICNSIGMIAAGNGVVFDLYPNAIATSNYAVDLINRASFEAGGPRVLVDKKNAKTDVVNKIVNRDCVGRDARVILEKIGIKVGPEVRCIICETDFEHPFVQHELMI